MNIHKHIALLTVFALCISPIANAGQGLRALTRIAPKVAHAAKPTQSPLKKHILKAPMMRNDFGAAFVGGMIIAAIGATIAACSCLCQPESDEKVLSDANNAIQTANRTIASIGGQNNVSIPITYENLTENQLTEFAQQMNIFNYPASTHRSAIDNSIHAISQISKELKLRINQRTNPQEQRIRSTMQTMVGQLDRTYTILQNRYQFVQAHEVFFDLYHVEMTASNHFNTLLFSPNVPESQLRAFANNTFKAKPFPYISFTQFLDRDINECARILRSYNLHNYPNQVAKVSVIKNKLESYLLLALASQAYQDAVYAKQQYELKQQELAQREEQIRLQARQTAAQEEQARAAREQAAAATVNAGANAIQAQASLQSAHAQREAALAAKVAANTQALALEVQLANQEEASRRYGSNPRPEGY
jgi:hypothetical protein